MGTEDRLDSVPVDVRRLIGSWEEIPALVRDRYLNVVASNELATAVSPMLAEGVNLARLALSCCAGGVGAPSRALPTAVVAALRNSLSRFESDERFEHLVAELSEANEAFATVWTAPESIPGEPAAESEAFVFVNGIVGEITMSFQELSLPNAFGLTVVVWRALDGPSATALSRLTGRPRPHPIGEHGHGGAT